MRNKLKIKIWCKLENLYDRAPDEYSVYSVWHLIAKLCSKFAPEQRYGVFE